MIYFREYPVWRVPCSDDFDLSPLILTDIGLHSKFQGIGPWSTHATCAVMALLTATRDWHHEIAIDP
jgi:hypothetical protein